jgi:hypothetical protein
MSTLQKRARRPLTAGLAALAAACIATHAAHAQDDILPKGDAVVHPSAEKQKMVDLGVEHKTAEGLYDYFKEQAHGGQPLTWQNVPDWTGLWTREASVFFFDPDQQPGTNPTAKLTPKYEQMFKDKIERVRKGIEYDPLSMCNPAGMPRWLVEPFLREFIVTPAQTYLITEQMNEVRRIYTDGRQHPAKEDSYPLWEGDSIGFWDGSALVIWTNQMRAGQYQRIQPEYSEQVEVVEKWKKLDDKTIAADVWIYDPPALLEPWYTKQVYKKVDDDGKSLRIRYWDCGENQNNTVIKNDQGTSDFKNFTFTDKDDAKQN